VEALSQGHRQEGGAGHSRSGSLSHHGALGKAIDEVRAQEAREIKARGQEPVLTKTRWLLLKRPENLTEKQEVRLADLLRYNLRSVRHGSRAPVVSVRPNFFAFFSLSF
jgi:hypothetical protein